MNFETSLGENFYDLLSNWTRRVDERQVQNRAEVLVCLTRKVNVEIGNLEGKLFAWGKNIRLGFRHDDDMAVLRDIMIERSDRQWDTRSCMYFVCFKTCFQIHILILKVFKQVHESFITLVL